MTAAPSATRLYPSRAAGDLWAITSYFNPLGYDRRRQNYRSFRDALDVPLIAVELAYGPEFELKDDDAEIVIRLRDGAVLWQKERLLNVALAALPAECRKVAWIDCDLVFGDGGWAGRLSDALDRHMLVQPFSRVHHTRQNADPGVREALATAILMSQTSTTSAMSAGEPARDAIMASMFRGASNHVAGFAWAARRELLDEHGLNDFCVIGGGDSELLCAALGLCDVAEKMHYHNPHQRERFGTWARPFHEAVNGSVASIDGDIYHLWHGDLSMRSAGPRHQRLSALGYDPSTDVIAADGGGWQWATDKPDLHRYVRDFFAARREDG